MTTTTIQRPHQLDRPAPGPNPATRTGHGVDQPSPAAELAAAFAHPSACPGTADRVLAMLVGPDGIDAPELAPSPGMPDVVRVRLAAHVIRRLQSQDPGHLALLVRGLHLMDQAAASA